MLMMEMIFTGHLRMVDSTLPYVFDRLSIIQSVNLISHIFFKVVLVSESSHLQKQWEFRPYRINTIPRLTKFIVDYWARSPTRSPTGRFASMRVGLDTRRMVDLIRQSNITPPGMVQARPSAVQARPSAVQARPSAGRALKNLRVPRATPVDREILPTGESGRESEEGKRRVGTATMV